MLDLYTPAKLNIAPEYRLWKRRFILEPNNLKVHISFQGG